MSANEPGNNGQHPVDARLDTQLLQAAVEGELEPAAAAEFERTLASDPELAGLVRELREQRETLRALPLAEPPARAMRAAGPRLERAVLLDEPLDPQAARSTAAESRGPGGFRFPVRWLATAAALAAVVGLGLYVSGVGDDRPTLADMADRIRVQEPGSLAVLPEPESADDPLSAVLADAAPDAAPPVAAPDPDPTAPSAMAAASVAENPEAETARMRQSRRGPAMVRAEEVGLDAFLLPEGEAASGSTPTPLKAAASPTESAAGAADSFRIDLLEDLSVGERQGVPAWARSETYFRLPPAADRR